MNQALVHDSVMLEQATDGLVQNSAGCYVDGTYGRGGHSKAILDRLDEAGRLIGVDQDPDAAKAARSLEQSDNRFFFVQDSFAHLLSIAQGHDVCGKVDGVLFDLGVSSPQLDDPQRGFSFNRDGPLDMRMDPEKGVSAAEWINKASESEIANVIRQFGEERYSRRIARAIVENRIEQRIETTGRFADIVKKAHPNWERDKHPATRVFQGVRIFINKELDSLQLALDQALQVLAIGGRLVVISFHSLEDKIVKKFISLQTKGDHFPRGLPVTQEQLNPTLEKIGKSMRPSPEEINRNPRARSAIMRIAQRIA